MLEPEPSPRVVNDPSPEPARADELAAVVALVAGVGLPCEGIGDAFPAGYAVAREGAQLVGVAGLEVHGDVGLLRSLAVAPGRRGSRLGRALVDDRVRAARSRGLSAVYLLTTTAADYFRRLGFVDAARASAPEALQRSSELASVCPASATLLVMRLA